MVIAGITAVGFAKWGWGVYIARADYQIQNFNKNKHNSKEEILARGVELRLG